MTRQEPTDSRLDRRLGTGDAVVVGLASMIGAGVFAVLGPAAAAAGGGLLIGLCLAGLVAYANATSSAELAAVYPRSGGAYVYGRERLGHAWGHLAGWGFVVGKTASCAAMALTFGTAVAPGAPRPAAVAAVVALTAINLAGIRKTALVTRAIVAFVLVVLALVVAAAAANPDASVTVASGGGDPRGVLRSAGLLFFAFAGYARIATLGEEVRDPATTIPRAIPRALLITLAVYAVVAVAALAALGPDRLAASPSPLVATVEASGWLGLSPVVRAGAAVASLGVLLSLLAGVARTVFAMAGEGDLPRALSAVSRRARTPARAELGVAAAVVVVVLLLDATGAIAFSAFAVLAYYAIANASALTLPPEQRRWPRALAAAGLAGCALLALNLPARTVLTGAAVLAAGALARLTGQRLSSHHRARVAKR